MQVMSSAKQHRKYDSIKSVERNKYDSCAHHWRFYFKELPKNKVLQVKNSYDNFWNILFICYLLLLFDFTRPLESHLSISHWAPFWSGRPCDESEQFYGLDFDSYRLTAQERNLCLAAHLVHDAHLVCLSISCQELSQPMYNDCFLFRHETVRTCGEQEHKQHLQWTHSSGENKSSSGSMQCTCSSWHVREQNEHYTNVAPYGFISY